MRRFLWVVFSLVSSQACAEWIRVGAAGDFSVYADPVTIRRTGALVRIWTLTDFKAPHSFQGQFYRSYRLQWEYDCVNPKQEIVVGIERYEGNMGKGRVVTAAPVIEEWEPAISKRISEDQRRFACATR